MNQLTFSLQMKICFSLSVWTELVATVHIHTRQWLLLVYEGEYQHRNIYS